MRVVGLICLALVLSACGREQVPGETQVVTVSVPHVVPSPYPVYIYLDKGECKCKCKCKDKKDHDKD